MKDTIRNILGKVIDPYLKTNLNDAGMVNDVQITDNGVQISLHYPYPAKSVFKQTAAEIKTQLGNAGMTNVNVQMTVNIHSHIVQGGVERLPKVKNIIVVSSAKGGVGKSATAVNLALALVYEGARVGVLDADIYGPSLPLMLGINKRPQGGENGGIKPLQAYGMDVMSIGFMIDEDQPMVWRGPIATRALTQLLRETQWRDLDYLVLDMPPGTGDIQLTTAQKAPVTGAVVVTTPQDIAISDAQKGLMMFNKVSISVLGVIENMSVYYCPQCGHKAHIFGAGGAAKMCEKYGVALLGEIPLLPAIRDAADSGCPSVVAEPDSDISQRYRQIANRIGAQIAQKARDRSMAFPKVVIGK